MKIKKTRLVLLLAVVGTAFTFLHFAPPPPPVADTPGQAIFERFPPIAKEYWVQKLRTPLSDGRNLIFRIHYVCDTALPSTINVYPTSTSMVSFVDDGTGPDLTAHDGIYAAYVYEDLTAFLHEEAALENALTIAGHYTVFTGHIGEELTSITPFDVTGFNSFNNTPLSVHLLEGADCSTDLKKENSLFITDLSVVEDLSRVYKIWDASKTPMPGPNGNPTGVWTFGNLIRNICNQYGTTTPNVTTGTGVSPKAFLKNWLQGWTNGRTINGVYVPARQDALTYMILPWLEAANGWSDGHYNSFLPITDPANPATNAYLAALNTQWESDWDATTESALLQYAPFRLMAIVNRLDLRGNSAYSTGITMPGETRFIYTLIAPITYFSPAAFSSIADVSQGTIPVNGTGFATAGTTNPTLDWRGMNVIFEFGNTQATNCDLQDYARSWLDLSDPTLPLGSSAYNTALEAITHTVLDAGAAPLRINGSALNRIRTNERIFFHSFLGIASNNATQSWTNSDWQLSQFELNSTHMLKAVPVTNTPVLAAQNDLGNTNLQLVTNSDFGSDPNAGSKLIDWIYGHQNQVLNGNHDLPATITYVDAVTSATKYLRSPVANIPAEQVHYWDLAWDASTTNYTTIPATSTTPNPTARNLRRQLSLNTCQGCHSGENKTLFTQMRPAGYGVPSVYWSNTSAPSTETGQVDFRFGRTNGSSYKNLVSGGESIFPYAAPSASSTGPNPYYAQRISAFLTGRAYHGGSDYSDDNSDGDNTLPADNPSDATFGNGLFYVFDPGDQKTGPSADVTRPLGDGWAGYNDLQMRKQGLCQFVQINCSGGNVFSTMRLTSHIPTGND